MVGVYDKGYPESEAKIIAIMNQSNKTMKPANK
jgi:hypothetical protein